MPRSIHVADEDLSWLRENHQVESYAVQAERIGCCIDTLKRILVREGLQDFDGAKYQVKRNHCQDRWSRPCMACGDSKARPKNHYFCRRCRRDRGYDD